MAKQRFDNSDGRIRGRALQERRLRIWSKHPHCAMCGDLVEFNAIPGFGFQLDHIIALTNGGADTDENCQILCVPKCHEKKTAKDLGHREVVRIGEDGYPIE